MRTYSEAEKEVVRDVLRRIRRKRKSLEKDGAPDPFTALDELAEELKSDILGGSDTGWY